MPRALPVLSPLAILAVCLLLAASCTPADVAPTLEGKWVSENETAYSYWPTGHFARFYEPVSIVGKLQLEITKDSIVWFDTKSYDNLGPLRRAYTRQDSMLLIRGNERQMHIKKLTADTLTLVLRGDTTKDRRLDVGYTFSHWKK
ncbi:hypothetical protein BEN47_15550 [Hymenobacter lapidarius]|uniref:Lipocalin-like domain-containing protein n=1 Tax=Hymenobacter lapidarius TaxID=1908237 RepID=A0A1G1T271_9BACT|nr:hypothetical protein BEN47_15550 [Hymenobacter lapidarius]